jgi:predicted phage tail protein
MYGYDASTLSLLERRQSTRVKESENQRTSEKARITSKNVTAGTDAGIALIRVLRARWRFSCASSMKSATETSDSVGMLWSSQNARY